MPTIKLTADTVFDALGDQNRRRILSMLNSGPKSVSQLTAPLHVTLAAVVQHLKVLEDSGLVRSQKVGRTRTCEIATPGFKVAQGWLSERQTAMEDKLDRLGSLLDSD